MRAAVGTLLVAVTAAVTVAACDSGSHAARHTASSTGSVSAPGSTAQATPSAAPSTGASGTSASHAPGAASTSMDTGTVAPYPTSSNGLVPDIPANQAAALNSLPGSAATTCATVGSHTDLRAGSVAAGNFVTARKSFASQYGKTEAPSVFLYLIPLHSKTMSKAVISIDPLGAGATKTVTSKDIETANQYRYFALNLPVPQPGSYLLTMVSGADRGCYDVTFSK